MDARVHQPVADLVELVLGQAEAPRDHGLLQQAEDVVDGEARGQQRQRVEQRARRCVDLGAGAAADRIGQVAFARRGAEDGVDQRRGGVEIGRDDEDVGRLRRVGPGHEREQAIVQHLQLAGERMADVHLDAAIAREGGERAGREFGHLEDGVLHRAQHARRTRRREPGVLDDAVGRGVDQQAQRRLRLPAPGGEQPVAFLVVRGLAARGEICEAARLDDLEPELLAGVQHVDVQVDMPAQALQQLEVHRRQGRQREHVGAGRQAAGAGQADAVRIEHLEQRQDGVAAVAGRLGGEAAPQRGLPLLVERGARVRAGVHAGQGDRLAAEPRLHPLGTVGEVLVEQAGHAPGQLVAHHGVGLLEPGGQARLGGRPRGVLERGEDAPGDHVGVELRLLPELGHQSLGLLPQPAREIGEVDVGAHALAARQLDDQAARDGRARHDDLVGLEGRTPRRLFAQATDELVGEGLEAVGEVEVEHAGQGGRRADCDGTAESRPRLRGLLSCPLTGSPHEPAPPPGLSWPIRPNRSPTRGARRRADGPSRRCRPSRRPWPRSPRWR